jgi:hypothetical protein
MAYRTCRAVAPDIEDTIYACRTCGTELIRTTARAAGGAEAA